MLKKQLILRDPLSFLGYETDETEKKGNFGAVTSRAGVGKTAFLVQIAISSLLKDKNVLHISIQDPVDKVNLWYKELFLNLTQNHDAKQSKQLWEALLAKRFIMTFETESFDFSKLISRIDELRTQDIFVPQLIILDGLSLDSSMQPELNQLKEYAVKNNFTIWFSVRTHRHQSDDPVSMLRQLGGKDNNLFNMIIQLLPHKDKIQVKRLSIDREMNERPPLLIDPSTMMIKETTDK
ncbi:MAG: cytoplasmic protein [Desulfobacteraceae bacterium]|nr:cytoplasmic protein [Desulfobacteraceae bacterium]MBC2757093.1 cytoplasmic protein [Desulfobacteraceae bacterium]MBC2763691.1 cytoplasmic protein [ANME-2 cluster archaeon]